MKLYYYVSGLFLVSVNSQNLDLGNSIGFLSNNTEIVCNVIQGLQSVENANTMNKKWVKAVCDRWTKNGAPANEEEWTRAMLAKLLGEDDRSLTCTGRCRVPLTLDDITDYGCWCNLGTNLLTGNSQPKDEYDEACKRMQLCMRCVVDDFGENNANCDPGTNQYESDFAWRANLNRLESRCKKKNRGNQCGQHFCMCEMHWLNDVLNLGFNSVLIDDNFKQLPTGPFDADNDCPTTGPGDRDMDCCGEYPLRYPFNKVVQECCTSVGEIFNPSTQVCCGNGNGVKAPGGCF